MTKRKEILRGKSIKELENLYETLISKSRLDFAYIIEILIEKYGEDICDKKVRQLELEYLVSKMREENTTNNRFPDLKREKVKNYFDKTGIDYLKERIEETTNPILKAKYCDIIYEINKREFEIGKLAIITYLQLAKCLFDHKLDWKYVDAIGRALSLSIFRKDENLIELSYKAHLENIEILRNENRNYTLLWIMRSLTEREKSLKKYDLDFGLFETIIEEIIEKQNTPCQKTYTLHRDFLELILSFPNIKKDKNKSFSIRKRIGNAFEYEGDYVGKTRSKTVAAWFYEEALQVYTSIGCDKTQVEELRKKIRISYEEAYKTEFFKVKKETTISQSSIDNVIEIYKDKNIDEFLMFLSLDPNVIVSYTSIKERVKISGFQAFIKDSVLKGSIRIKDNSTIEEKIENKAIIEVAYWIEFVSKEVLDRLFVLFRTSYPTYSESLLEKVSSSNLVNENRKKLIEHGINLYSKGDYISSMHILSFQIEGILRDTLYTIDGEDFIYRNNEMREFTLGATIRKLTEKEIFNVDFLKFIEINMCHLQGKNIRNDIAHGNTNPSLFTRYNSQILLLILLKITACDLIPNQSTN